MIQKQNNSFAPRQRSDHSNQGDWSIPSQSQPIQCSECKRNITKCTKIKTADNHYYCCSCFGNLPAFSGNYQVIHKLDYPLLEQDWTAEQELLLFQGLEKHGYGNWQDIAACINSDKTALDVQDHYQRVYLVGTHFLPQNNVLSCRDAVGTIVPLVPAVQVKKREKIEAPKTGPVNTIQSSRASAPVNQTVKSPSTPAQIVGFLPRRQDFQTEYDNDAQLLLAQMQFNEDDSAEQKGIKFRLLDIYNHKLNERIKRKQFVISGKLLDLREQLRVDKTRTKEEKEIYNMMKVYARFNSPETHDRLVQDIIKEKQMRQRLEELKEMKRRGVRTLGEIEDELMGRKRKDDRGKKKESDGASISDKTRRMRKDPGAEKSDKRVLFINHEEEQLCRKLNMTFKQYMQMKETLLRESVRLGCVDREESIQLLRVKRQIAEAVFDFLVVQENIVQHQKFEEVILNLQ